MDAENFLGKRIEFCEGFRLWELGYTQGIVTATYNDRLLISVPEYNKPLTVTKDEWGMLRILDQK